MKSLSRREFFRASMYATLGGVAAACAKKTKNVFGGPVTLSSVLKGHSQTVEMTASGTEIMSRSPDRFVFILVDPSDGSRISSPTATVWIARDQHSSVIGPLTASYRDQGLPVEKGFYEAPIDIPSDGTWLAACMATRQGLSRADFSVAQFVVGRQTAMPRQGDAAIIVPTPTYSNHRGVNPICTASPICSMHGLSLDAALKNGHPTVLILATPKFCQSALCGPEVKVVQAISKELHERANFVHIEIYPNENPETIQRQILSPAAHAWRLEQEPAIYYIGANGIIKSRTIGPADLTDVRMAATALMP